jgi:hypothetical protein
MDITPHPAAHSSLQQMPAAAPANGHPVPVDNGLGAVAQTAHFAHPAGGLHNLDVSSRIPEDALEHIAGYLPPREIGRLAGADTHTRTALNGPRLAARMSVEAESVSTQAAFSQLLGPAGTQLNDGSNGIRSLHPRHRAAPLSALTLRLNFLSLEDAQAVFTNDFVTAFEGLPVDHHTPVLSARLCAARMGMGFAARASGVDTVAEFSRLLGSADTPVNDTITSLHPSIQALPLSALALRICLLRPEEGDDDEDVDVEDVTNDFLDAFDTLAEEHRTPELTSLAQVAAYSIDEFGARAAVRRGANVLHTARFYDVTEHDTIQLLEQEAAFSGLPGSAGSAARSGEHLQTVADRFGMNSEHGRTLLELQAVLNGAAREAAGSSQNLQAVAEQFGINSTVARGHLEVEAACSHHPESAGTAVRGGRTVAEVADQFRIVTEAGLAELQQQFLFANPNQPQPH